MDLKVVYFPSCLNQMMGPAPKDKVRPLVEETVELLNKAGYEVIFPEMMDSLCCGTIWESKGLPEIADKKTRELEEALWKASCEGRYPVLCDQSPCLHRMSKCIKKMHLYEPAEFIWKFLRNRLEFHPVDEPVAVHITCTMRLMGLEDCVVSLARLCSMDVTVPEGVGCCAFAGDKGMTNPELNAWALRKLRPALEQAGVREGFSNSRTCEIGLSRHGGVPYRSIVYLVNRVTTPCLRDFEKSE
jgi:D-lactate dehydrogenase